MGMLVIRRDGYVATWHGGEYVEIRLDRGTTGKSLEGPVLDVVNVWEYETGRARIEENLSSLDRVLGEWIEEQVRREEER